MASRTSRRLRNRDAEGGRVARADRARRRHAPDDDMPELIIALSPLRQRNRRRGDASRPIDVEATAEVVRSTSSASASSKEALKSLLKKSEVPPGGHAKNRSCIDLTFDPDTETPGQGHLVDLTDNTSSSDVTTAPSVEEDDSPIVILSSTSTDSRSRNDRTIDLEDTELDSVTSDEPPAVFDSPGASVADPAADTSLLSTPGYTLRCPVCFDSKRTIRSSGKRLMSTTCGHVFCSDCISGAIDAQRRCPTCRKKLKPSQVHPIFI